MQQYLVRLLGSAGYLTPLDFIVRALIVYLVLLFMTRLAGQQTISKLSAFDLVTAIVVGNIAAAPLDNTTVSLWAPLLTVATLLTLQYILASLSLHSKFFGRYVGGESAVLIQNGQIQEEALQKARLTLGDLTSQLRQKKAFNISDVELAILEPEGKLSVLKKKSKQTPTKQDLGKGVGARQHYPAILVRDGQLLPDNLDRAGLSESWLRNRLSSLGVRHLDQIFVAQLTTSGKLYVDLFNDQQHLEDVSKDLTITGLKKAQAKLSSFALETKNQQAAQAYQQMAERCQKVTRNLESTWRSELKLYTHKQ